VSNERYIAFIVRHVRLLAVIARNMKCCISSSLDQESGQDHDDPIIELINGCDENRLFLKA
jgi:hypothetical protein